MAEGPGELRPDWDALLTLREAATISGLSYSYLRARVAEGTLKTQKVGARLNMTTRRWLDAFLQERGSQKGPGRPPKALPKDYQGPPRGRPRTVQMRAHNGTEEERP